MRVLILLCMQIDPNTKVEADAGQIPYPEYLALQKLTDATLFSFEDVKKSTHPLVRLARRQSLKYGLVMLGFINRRRYDQIYCTGEDVAIPFGFVMKFALDFGRITAVIHHGGTPKRRLLLRLLGGRVFRNIICLSEEQERVLVEIIGLPKDKVHLLPLWLDHKFYDPEKVVNGQGNDDGYGLSVGQESRDYATLNRAISELSLQFRIVASGWSPSGFSLAEGVYDTTNVKVEKGGLSYVELRQRYAGARIVIVPLENVTYAAGVTSICEAMAMKKPVIASASPGVADYIQDGVSGIVVPVGDAEALRQAITKLWNDPELCHRMGEYNRKWVIESFSTWHYAERAAGMMGVEVVDAIHPE